MNMTTVKEEFRTQVDNHKQYLAGAVEERAEQARFAQAQMIFGMAKLLEPDSREHVDGILYGPLLQDQELTALERRAIVGASVLETTLDRMESGVLGRSVPGVTKGEIGDFKTKVEEAVQAYQNMYQGNAMLR